MGRRDPLVTEASDHTVYTAAPLVVAPVALSRAAAQASLVHRIILVTFPMILSA